MKDITVLNPECKISDYSDTIPGSGVVDLPEAAFNAADVDGDGKVRRCAVYPDLLHGEHDRRKSDGVGRFNQSVTKKKEVLL